MDGRYFLAIRMKSGRFARAVLQNSSLGISLAALLISGAALYNTIYQQDRDFAHKELLIQPRLTFVADAGNPVENTYQFSFGVRNDGLGPAVVQELIIQTGEQCLESSGFKTFDEWEKAYLTKVIPQFDKVLTDQVKELTQGSVADSKPFEILKSPDGVKTGKSAKNDLGYTDYKAFDVYGVDRDNSKFRVATLTPGMIIAAGAIYTIAEVKTERTSTVTRIIPRKKSPVGTEFAVALPSISGPPTQPLRLFDDLGIGIGYCSFSGISCDFIWQGVAKCLEKTSPQQ